MCVTLVFMQSFTFKEISIINRGIKHDFPFINIRKVPREVLKTEGETGVEYFFINILLKSSWQLLMNDKIMFDCYNYYIKSKPLQK